MKNTPVSGLTGWHKKREREEKRGRQSVWQFLICKTRLFYIHIKKGKIAS